MTDWIPIDTERGWPGPMLLVAELPRTQLRTEFGSPQWVDVRREGVAPFDAWLVRFDCGLDVGMRSFEGRALPTPTRNHRDAIEVYASHRDRDHLLFHLGLSREQVVAAKAHRLVDAPRAHQVLRLDDNGNQFQVTRTSSACEANAIAQAYEAKGHKQTYWTRELKAVSRAGQTDRPRVV